MESQDLTKGFNSVISEKARFGINCKIGLFCIVEDDVIIGDNVQIGDYCKIFNGVTIGNNTRVQSFVEMRSNTTIGNDCYIDSFVAFSGESVIGNNVTLRYSAIIARGVRIGDNTYVCPLVMTNNLDSSKHSIGGAHIGANCFIGTNAVLNHGIIIENNVTIGSLSFVNQNCSAGKTYVGTPAREIVKAAPGNTQA